MKSPFQNPLADRIADYAWGVGYVAALIAAAKNLEAISHAPEVSRMLRSTALKLRAENRAAWQKLKPYAASFAASAINKPTQGRSETRFPGLSRHADALGVHRNHLWLVLSGRRKSKALLTRYRALLKKEGRALPHDLAA